MIPVFLTNIKTKDGVVLDGIVSKPNKHAKTAIIWIHGLTSRFSSGQEFLKEFVPRAKREGIIFLKFNTRGHDIAVRNGEKIIGGCFERFEDCIYDIQATICFAKTLGAKRIILAGHSTGANKILYYMYKTRDRAVRGLALLGPLSDVSIGLKEFGEKKLRRALDIAERLKNKSPHLPARYLGRCGDKKDALMPSEYGFWSPQRFLSLNRAGSAEDVFPYHNPDAKWKELKSIRVPLAVIIGARDEYRDRPAKNLIKIFQKNALWTKSFSGFIIAGANHGFRKKEKELTEAILNWIHSLVSFRIPAFARTGPMRNPADIILDSGLKLE